jgi:hypothetical protein
MIRWAMNSNQSMQNKTKQNETKTWWSGVDLTSWYQTVNPLKQLADIVEIVTKIEKSFPWFIHRLGTSAHLRKHQQCSWCRVDSHEQIQNESWKRQIGILPEEYCDLNVP